MILFNCVNSFSNGINVCKTIQNDSIKKSLYINPINDVTLLLSQIDIGIQITKRVKEISYKEISRSSEFIIRGIFLFGVKIKR